ncbi:MAG: hypothetical protein M3O61_06800 [Gemmatimonadota bacterium]|nr:hypothetical protein [Gemmatimonadota bacterium]
MNSRATVVAFLLSLAAALILPAAAVAQYVPPQTAPPKQDSTKPTGTSPPQSAAPAPAPPALNFSGVIFGNYQYHGEAANRAQNRFELERAYLNFRLAAGKRASVRITTDVFQQTSSANNADAFYRGWVIRAKYAFLQYDYIQPANTSGFGALARIGLLHNMFIDHEESFWPRWLSTVAVDRAGYFSSSDAGLATLLTFPNKIGELYAAVYNGPSYTSREVDRFKDFGARLTFTPLGKSDLTYLRTFAIDGWVYRGAIASRFVNGGPGQVGTVGDALARNRWGVFAGIKDPRLIIGADYAQRHDEGEGTSLNTPASPRLVSDSTGRLFSAYTHIKPFLMANPGSPIPLGIVARLDNVKPNKSSDGHYNLVIAGLTWDLNKQTAIALDYQEQTPKHTTAVVPTRVYYLHVVTSF